jgi:DNA-binding transcriptional MerR regulator
MDKPIRLLFSAHAGRRLGVGPERIRALAKEGRLPVAATLPNGARLFIEEDVEALKAEREAAHASQ